MFAHEHIEHNVMYNGPFLISNHMQEEYQAE